MLDALVIIQTMSLLNLHLFLCVFVVMFSQELVLLGGIILARKKSSFFILFLHFITVLHTSRNCSEPE